MNNLHIFLLIITFIFVICSYLSVKKHQKHDSVLFMFCQIRRNLMQELRERYDDISQQEYEAATFLLNMLNNIVKHYSDYKLNFFNLRKFRKLIEQDMRYYQETSQNLKKHLPHVPQGTKIHKIYMNFSIVLIKSFFIYTPFLRTEAIARIIANDFKEDLQKMREELKNGGNREFA